MLLLAVTPSTAQTSIAAELVDIDDGESGDLWRVDYRLLAPFAYGWGHGIVIWVPLEDTLRMGSVSGEGGCGWDTALIVEDARLATGGALDSQSKASGECESTPSTSLGSLQLTWGGEGPTPAATHHYEVYDEHFATVESGTITVPEPGRRVGQLIALLLIAAVAMRRRMPRPVTATLFALLVAGASAARARPVEDTVIHVYSVGDYEVSIRPVEYERRTREAFDYSFEVSVLNDGPSAPAGLLNILDKEATSSVTRGLLALPALDTDESIILEDRLEIALDRTSVLFEPEDLALCVIPQPVPGPQPPGSDLAIATMDAFIATCAQVDKGIPEWRTLLPPPPTLTFTESATYSWTLETSVGTMVFALDPEVAPQHVSNLIYLTRLGFYNGLTFHRIIRNFLAQGGDPLGNGTGGPGYSMYSELDPDVRHMGAGVLSTAHSGEGTDGSQIQITFADAPSLDGVHTITGNLSSGGDALDALNDAGSVTGIPIMQVEIESASISVD